MTPRNRQTLTSMPRLSKMDGPTRREFIKMMGFGVAALGVGPALLAACGDSGETAATGGGGGGGGSTELKIANWPFYIDPGGDDSYFETSTLDDFRAEYGLDVSYLEEINDNNEWFGKYQAPLSAGQDIDRDIAVLTDWMAARFIRLDWVEEIDKANVPNSANLLDSLKSPGFDPSRTYTLPWQSGLTAIGYDPNRTGRELTSINDIFDPAFAGRVTMLTEMRDTVGLVMLGLGLDPAQATVEDAAKATAKIQEAVDSGQIRRFTGNDYVDDLVSGNVWAAFAWSGDIIQAQLDNPDLQFLVPEEGLMLWSDNMLIPAGAKNKENAELFMNYVYDPKVAAKIESWVNFICPVQGAQEAMRELATEIDDEDLAALADDPLIFPDAAALAKTNVFKNLDEEEETQFNELFEAVIGA